MKALTLHQPWASLVAVGAKTIETRSWTTNYRGPLAIHAAMRDVPHASRNVGPWVVLDHQEPHYWAMVRAEPRTTTSRCSVGSDYTSLPLGAIVATCELVDVVPVEASIITDGTDYAGNTPGGGWLRHPTGWVTVTQTEIALGDYSGGRYAWLLDNIVALDEPIPAKGRQGLWTWEPKGDPA